MTARDHELNLTWRIMVRLTPELGKEIESIADRELTAPATVARRLIAERLEQLRRDHQRECGR
jgi:hypothetical protein